MKKKVLPQFYRKYTSAEQLLFVTCKAHFRALKREGLVIIPFAYTVKKSQTEPHLLSPSTLQNNSKLSFIDQFLEKGRNLKKHKLSLCFAVCYDAHVFDEEHIDQDALVLLLQKENDTKAQINIPYVEEAGEVVFGEEWVEKT